MLVQINGGYSLGDLHSNEDLLLRACQGDALAFEQFYSRLRPQVLRFVSARTDDKSLVEDVVQEAFCRIWAGRACFTCRSSARTFLCRVAMNILADQHDAKRRFTGYANIAIDLAAVPQCNDLEQSQLVAIVHDAYTTLVPTQADAMKCVYDLGMSPKAAAPLIGCSEKAFRRRLELARANLRSRLRSLIE